MLPDISTTNTTESARARVPKKADPLAASAPRCPQRGDRVEASLAASGARAGRHGALDRGHSLHRWRQRLFNVAASPRFGAADRHAVEQIAAVALLISDPPVNRRAVADCAHGDQERGQKQQHQEMEHERQAGRIPLRSRWQRNRRLTSRGGSRMGRLIESRVGRV